MANPWKLLTFLIVRGCGHSVMAFTFQGPQKLPRKKQRILGRQLCQHRRHTSLVHVKLLSLECAEDLPQIAHMLLLSSAVNQYIIKVYHYEFIDKWQNNWVITLMKVLGALDSPKCITNHSYSPSLVLNAVFHSSPSQILIWWYPLLRSILEKIMAPGIRSSISSRRRMGNDTLLWSYWLCDYPHTYAMCHLWRQKCRNCTRVQTFFDEFLIK